MIVFMTSVGIFSNSLLVLHKFSMVCVKNDQLLTTLSVV